MSDRLYLVFSAAPEGVAPDEYDRWYHRHVRENIEVEGFRAARRYTAQPVRGDGAAVPGHLALYEYEGDIAVLRRRLAERLERGEIVLPEWFDRIPFASWDCAAIEPRVQADE
ncbi:MAG TPA: hypothetical protein VGM91_03690 [Conexibacter sp.]|jgi:hypothetical protein